MEIEQAAKERIANEKRFFKNAEEGLNELIQRQIEAERRFFDIDRTKVENYVELLTSIAVKRYKILAKERLGDLRAEVLAIDDRLNELLDKKILEDEEFNAQDREELNTLEDMKKTITDIEWMSARQIILAFLTLKSDESNMPRTQISKAYEEFLSEDSKLTIMNFFGMKDFLREMGRYDDLKGDKVLNILNEITGKVSDNESKLAKLMLNYARAGKPIKGSDLAKENLLNPSTSRDYYCTFLERICKNDVQKAKVLTCEFLATKMNQICFLTFVLEIFRRKYNKTLITDLPFALAQARAIELVSNGHISMSDMFNDDAEFGIATGKELAKNKDKLIKKLCNINTKYLNVIKTKDEKADNFLKENPNGMVVSTLEELHQELLATFTPKLIIKELKAQHTQSYVLTMRLKSLEDPDSEGEEYLPKNTKSEIQDKNKSRKRKPSISGDSPILSQNDPNKVVKSAKREEIKSVEPRNL